MKRIVRKLLKPLSFVGCPKCHKITFKRIQNSDDSFYWKCTSCLYESKLNKR